MWSIVEINGENAGIEGKDQYGSPVVDRESFAEDLDSVKLINGTAGDVVCKNCGERWDSTQEAPTDEECPDGEDDEATHELSADHLAWFDEAVVRVRDAEEEVSVELHVKGKRFRIGVHFAKNVDGGSLVLSLPGTSGTREVDGVTVVAD